MKKNKTTQKDFEIFKAEVIRLQSLFNLRDYDIQFRLSKIEECIAQCEWFPEGRIALFVLNTEYYNNVDFKVVGLHEMTHLLISPLVDLCKNRFVTEEQIHLVEEKIATIMEKLIIT